VGQGLVTVAEDRMVQWSTASAGLDPRLYRTSAGRYYTCFVTSKR